MEQTKLLLGGRRLCCNGQDTGSSIRHLEGRRLRGIFNDDSWGKRYLSDDRCFGGWDVDSW